LRTSEIGGFKELSWRRGAGLCLFVLLVVFVVGLLCLNVRRIHLCVF